MGQPHRTDGTSLAQSAARWDSSLGCIGMGPGARASLRFSPWLERAASFRQDAARACGCRSGDALEGRRFPLDRERPGPSSDSMCG